jgi:hypothetical protein
MSCLTKKKAVLLKRGSWTGLLPFLPEHSVLAGGIKTKSFGIKISFINNKVSII